MLKLKEVCHDFYSKINDYESQAIGDNDLNRKFVARKILKELERTPEVQADEALVGVKKYLLRTQG